MKFLEIVDNISKTKMSNKLFKFVREWAVRNGMQVIYDDLSRARKVKGKWAVPFSRTSKFQLTNDVVPTILAEQIDENIRTRLISFLTKITTPQRLDEHPILTESRTAKFREYDHIEDLVLLEGAEGARKVLDILNGFAGDEQDLTVKFDGKPTVYFGRDPDGQFVMTGKNGWGKHKTTNQKDLYNYALTSGKGEAWRKDFAAALAGCWPFIEQSCPSGFRGYVYGDLLFSPQKPVKKDGGLYTFQPNKVAYSVSPGSDIGKKVGSAKVGMVLHNTFGQFGDQSPKVIQDVDPFNSDSVFAIGPTFVDNKEIQLKDLRELKNFVDKNGQTIDMTLAGKPGLKDIRTIMYRFMNQTAKQKKLGDLSEKLFFNWLKTSNVSQGKQAKIAEIRADVPNGFASIFELMKYVIEVKNDIIDQLDQQNAGITANTEGKPGGEGYISPKHKIKLIPRNRWIPDF